MTTVLVPLFNIHHEIDPADEQRPAVAIPLAHNSEEIADVGELDLLDYLESNGMIDDGPADTVEDDTLDFTCMGTFELEKFVDDPNDMAGTLGLELMIDDASDMVGTMAISSAVQDVCGAGEDIVGLAY